MVDMIQGEVIALCADFDEAVSQEAWRRSHRADALHSMDDNRRAKKEWDGAHEQEWKRHLTKDAREKARVAQLEVDRLAALAARKEQARQQAAVDTKLDMSAFEKRLERVVGLEVCSFFQNIL